LELCLIWDWFHSIRISCTSHLSCESSNCDIQLQKLFEFQVRNVVWQCWICQCLDTHNCKI
jgi:hypothetical protein